MIKVTVGELRQYIKRLNVALNDFSGYTANYISRSCDSLNESNSDFLEAVNSALKNMQDTEAPELYKDLVAFCKAANNYVCQFEQQDESISRDLEKER